MDFNPTISPVQLQEFLRHVGERSRADVQQPQLCDAGGRLAVEHLQGGVNGLALRF